MNIIAVIFILLLLLFLSALAFIVAVTQFLHCLCQTLKLICPEHRQLSPVLVWLCLIPGIGSILGFWVIWGMAASLRKQFESLEDHRPGDSYGLAPGLVWKSSLAALALIVCLALFCDLSFLKSLSVDVRLLGVFALLFLMTPACAFSGYWERIIEYKVRLEKHAMSGRISGLTQEELDYGEDIRERKPRGDIRPGTNG
ncbi:hypothetical protein [Zavarzinella formosa]|uniref:hypothetical protein n=1 Tax=Zavarzinella formosa TaxID=360055 RepID=UPI0002FA00EB|nr:hypothetical protein [Zavarzinella formosa]